MAPKILKRYVDHSLAESQNKAQSLKFVDILNFQNQEYLSNTNKPEPNYANNDSNYKYAIKLPWITNHWP